MRSFYDLKDSVFDTFERRKLELKGEGKAQIGFHLYGFMFSQMRQFSRFRDFANRKIGRRDFSTVFCLFLALRVRVL
ncbi:hypothetical protein [Bartonella queenslandensis]|uniref:hypothetical protein n=1 Tax=Bartonella queenslandensis TaxID=481138 RepID=UPI001BAA735A|nr:hypothetical protein [Bartonella queenslandensis]